MIYTNIFQRFKGQCTRYSMKIEWLHNGYDVI